jgi:hypothetical protein
MPLSDVFELDSIILNVPKLMRSLFSVSCLTNVKSLVEFDGQQVTIRDNRHGSGKFLGNGVQECDLTGYLKI